MSVYDQLSVLVLILICFGLYKFLKSKKRKRSLLPMVSEEELRPYFSNLDLQHEATVRKQWLISFFAFTAMQIVSAFFVYINNGGFKEFAATYGIAFSALIGLAISFLAPISNAWITYHCSCKKRGTAWIMWTIIMLPLRELADFAKEGWDQVLLPIVVTALGIELFYWVNCIRLHKVNAAREYQKVRAIKDKYGPDADGFAN